MAPQSAVDRAAMQQAAGDLEDSANLIRGLQSQLADHKAQVRAGWEGTASNAFEGVFAQFNEDFTKVLSALQQMHEQLVQTKIVYEAREQEEQEAVTKVHQLLNGST